MKGDRRFFLAESAEVFEIAVGSGRHHVNMDIAERTQRLQYRSVQPGTVRPSHSQKEVSHTGRGQCDLPLRPLSFRPNKRVADQCVAFTAA